jgi:hypothetical protein
MSLSIYARLKKNIEEGQKDDYIRGAIEYYLGNSVKLELGVRFKDTDIERYGGEREQYYAKIFKKFGEILKLSSNYEYTKYSPEYRGVNPRKKIHIEMEVKW